VDLLSASFDDDLIAWYESDGGSPPSFTAHTITTGAWCARAVHAADVDRDGDMDVLSGTQRDHDIVWYVNEVTPIGAGHGPRRPAGTDRADAGGIRRRRDLRPAGQLRNQPAGGLDARTGDGVLLPRPRAKRLRSGHLRVRLRGCRACERGLSLGRNRA
jgi:hypothetical protein